LKITRKYRCANYIPVDLCFVVFYDWLSSNDNELNKFGINVIGHTFIQSPEKNDLTIYQERNLIELIIKKFKNYETELQSRILYKLSQMGLNKNNIIKINTFFINNMENSRTNEDFNVFYNNYKYFVVFHIYVLDDYISIINNKKINYEIELSDHFQILERVIKRYKDYQDIILYIRESLIKNRKIMRHPNNKSILINFKNVPIYLERFPITIKLIDEIISLKDLSKPNYGWYYERYILVEKEFIELTNYIPLTNNIDNPNYKFGSPEQVNMLIKIGTMIDSTIKNYIDLTKEYYDIDLRSKEKLRYNFYEDISDLSKLFPITRVKLKLRDHPSISIRPLQLVHNRINKRGEKDHRPKWYILYSSEKHNLIEMENKITMIDLIRGLGALYILTVFHPDNIYNNEYDWDSRIFDKYTIKPLINEKYLKIIRNKR